MKVSNNKKAIYYVDHDLWIIVFRPVSFWTATITWNFQQTTKVCVLTNRNHFLMRICETETMQGL